MRIAVFLSLLLCFSHFLKAQQIPDSLLQMPKDTLIARYSKTRIRSEKELYGKALIEKAGSEKDRSGLVTGYYLMVLFYKKDERTLMYCDSIIALTEKSPDKLYPASAYLMKGSFYHKKRYFKDALESYIDADTYATQYDNKSLIFKIKYAISILKGSLGPSEEAIQLRRENIAYAKKYPKYVDQMDYLNTIFALADTFSVLKSLDSAAFYESYGIRESLRLKNRRKYHHFVLNSGVTHYRRKHYQSALDSLEKALKYFEKADDITNMTFGYHYLGKLYFELNEDDKAVFYLQQADTLFRQHKSLLPKIRESYTLLVNHYKNKNDPEEQINYMEQRTLLDSIRYHHERDLGKNIITGYDIPRLNIEKENITYQLMASERRERRNVVIIWMISVLLALVLLLFTYQYKKRRLYKKQAEALINEQDVMLKNTEEKRLPKEAIGISEAIVNSILSGLKTFEEKNGYLDSELNIHTLAKKLRTNANYLSKVINYHKNLSFTHYINQLRIAYAVNALKTDAIYRKFTIEAIAHEFGFNTRDAFSRAFYKHTGTKPSYFLKELRYQ